MKKLHGLVMSLFAASVVWGQGVQAADAPVKAVPLELYACTWQEGKTMKDLQKVNTQFNKWAKKHDAGYTAWTITPQFRSSEQPFGVGWIGAWPDGASMGAGIQAFRDSGSEMGKAFAEVVDCSDSHGLFSSAVLNPPEGGALKTPLVQFSSCSINEGKTAEDAHNAHKAFGDFMIGKGGLSASWMLWPALGAGDIDFEYYAVSAYASYAQLGVAFEAYANGGGWQKAKNELFSVVTCDEPRLYDGLLVRDGTGS
ncbi:MAG: hypothetical protein IMF06_12780 [Proteobacteria bacterium]|nr:hypothetical protein [Pseudomonadota bacterium]